MRKNTFLALGTITTYALFHGDHAALADEIPAGGDAAPPFAQLNVRRFDFDAGPLDQILDAYSRATGVVVATSLPRADLARFTSAGAHGLFTAEQALRELLTGTALSYSFKSRDRVFIGVSETDIIDVTAAAPSSLNESLPKYTAPLRDTPQSIAAVPREVMEQQATTTLRDALRNVAGISLAAGEGGAQGDNLTIRGFSSRNDLFIDGMRDFGSYYRDPFALEEVEVLKGPSSVTFGRGSTGGVVNQASKSPRRDAFLGVEATLGSAEMRRATADVNQPIGENTALRINLMSHDAGVAGRDGAHNRRFGALASLATGLGTESHLTFDYLHQTADDVPDYGMPWLFDRPAAVRRENFYGFTDGGNFLRTNVDVATLRAERTAGTLSLRSQLRYAHYGRDARITEARMPASATPSTPLDSITVARTQIGARSVESFVQAQSDVTANFATGGVHHTLVAGIEVGRETSDPTRFTFTGVPGTGLTHPNPGDRFAGTPAVSSDVQASAISGAVYAFDNAALSERLTVSGGVRFDRFAMQYRNAVPAPVRFERTDQKPTWRAAVVYKPRANGSVYADMSTSFNPSAESLSLSAATANLDPESNRTAELGTKWDFGGDRLSLRAAIYRTDKLNAREPDPSNALLNVLAGKQRVTGKELELSGRITSRWQLLAAYAHTKSRVVDSKAFPLAIGLPLANVPENTASVWNDIRLGDDFDVGIGGQYVGSRTASTTAPFDPATGRLKVAPSFWTLSAMASRRISERLALQLNADNLTNAFYFDQLHPAHVVPGAARSLRLAIRFRSGAR